MTNQPHQELLQAIIEFGLTHPDPKVDRFKASLGNWSDEWGDEWKDVGTRYLPAIESLQPALDSVPDNLKPLLALFEKHKNHLYWEQSYRKQDGVVSDEMLASYGFAEIIGSRGPFVSERIRAGVGIYGANTIYPRHQHQAEEIYILLSGSATYKISDNEEVIHRPGDVIFIESNTPHGFRNGDEALIVYYLWQAGDLRQISNFD